MKPLALISLACLPAWAGAQLVAPPNPAGWTHQRAIGAYQPVPGEGPGQIWDFSSASPQQTFTHIFTEASGSFYSKTFPYAEWQLEESGVDMFYASTDGLTYFGGVQQGMVIFYDDPEVSYPYPIAVGDTHVDAFGGSYNGGEQVTRSGSTETNCVAVGSLALPGGLVFSEAYKLHTVQSILDSTDAGNFYLTIEADYVVVPEWPLPVFGAYTVTSEDQISGTPVQTTTFNSWLQGVAVGLEEAARPAGFALYPNPVLSGTSATLVWSAAPPAFRVLDAQGRVVHEQTVAFGTSFSHLFVDGWAPGRYYVEAAGRTLQFIVN